MAELRKRKSKFPLEKKSHTPKYIKTKEIILYKQQETQISIKKKKIIEKSTKRNGNSSTKLDEINEFSNQYTVKNNNNGIDCSSELTLIKQNKNGFSSEKTQSRQIKNIEDYYISCNSNDKMEEDILSLYWNGDNNKSSSEKLNLLCEENFDLSLNENETKNINKINLFSKEEETLKIQQNNKIFLEEIAQFENIYNNTYTGPFDNECLTNIQQREETYLPSNNYPYNFNKINPELKPDMRGILLDWMMEVSCEAMLKRETFALAVSYLDRFLSMKSVGRNELQLVGITVLFIASKMEAFKWDLTPMTFHSWSNFILYQWDNYLHSSNEMRYYLNAFHCVFSQWEFKQPNQESYQNNRQFFQYLDLMILEISTLEYQPKPLISALLYLLIGKSSKLFNETIILSFQKNSSFLVNPNYQFFNQMFTNFFNQFFGFQLFDLLPYIQYVCTFFVLKLNFDMPIAAKINKESVLNGHFEEFLAYQTHNSNNLQSLGDRKNLFKF